MQQGESVFSMKVSGSIPNTLTRFYSQ